MKNDKTKYLKECHLEVYFKKIKCNNDYIRETIRLKPLLCGNFAICRFFSLGS